MDRREDLKSLKNTCEKAQRKLQETEKELATAQAENQTLRLQVLLGTHLWLKIKGEIRLIQIKIFLSSQERKSKSLIKSHHYIFR